MKSFSYTKLQRKLEVPPKQSVFSSNFESFWRQPMHSQSFIFSCLHVGVADFP